MKTSRRLSPEWLGIIKGGYSEGLDVSLLLSFFAHFYFYSFIFDSFLFRMDLWRREGKGQEVTWMDLGSETGLCAAGSRGKSASCSTCKPSKCGPGCQIKHFSPSFFQKLIWMKAMLWLPEQGGDFGNTGGCFFFLSKVLKSLSEQFKKMHITRGIGLSNGRKWPFHWRTILCIINCHLQ